MNKGIKNGVNQAGKADSPDEMTKVRFQKRNNDPWVLLFTSILNAFGNMFSPIKEEKKKK
jgi:hypothetical protein